MHKAFLRLIIRQFFLLSLLVCNYLVSSLACVHVTNRTSHGIGLRYASASRVSYESRTTLVKYGGGLLLTSQFRLEMLPFTIQSVKDVIIEMDNVQRNHAIADRLKGHLNHGRYFSSRF